MKMRAPVYELPLQGTLFPEITYFELDLSRGEEAHQLIGLMLLPDPRHVHATLHPGNMKQY